jgi:hypothetical protein
MVFLKEEMMNPILCTLSRHFAQNKMSPLLLIRLRDLREQTRAELKASNTELNDSMLISMGKMGVYGRRQPVKTVVVNTSPHGNKKHRDVFCIPSHEMVVRIELRVFDYSTLRKVRIDLDSIEGCQPYATKFIMNSSVGM